MKTTNLFRFVSLCSIFCLLLFVQSANAQTDRTQEPDPQNDSGSATDPNNAKFGAAPGKAGELGREQKFKDAIQAAIRGFNAEQKGFGYPPIVGDAELSKLMSNPEFVNNFKGFLTGLSTTIRVTVKNDGPGLVNLAFADGRQEQIPPKSLKTIQGNFGNVKLFSTSDWAAIELIPDSEFSFMDGDDQKTYDLKPSHSFKRELQMGKQHYVLQPK